MTKKNFSVTFTARREKPTQGKPGKTMVNGLKERIDFWAFPDSFA